MKAQANSVSFVLSRSPVVWHSNSKSPGKSSCGEIIAELAEQDLAIGPNIELGLLSDECVLLCNECTARLIKARVPKETPGSAR